jgi:RimJ/RimL family protein N-acetyltransferase
MFAWPQPTLTTERLLLRPLQLADAPTIQCLAGAWEIAQMTLLVPHPYGDGLAEKWIRTVQHDWKDSRAAVFGVETRAGSHFCAAIGLRLELEYQRAELGYWVGLPFWGQGYATEAGQAVIAFGFNSLGLHRIYAQHFQRNPVSGRVLRKLGFQYEGCLREHVNRWDRFENLECYGLLRADWSATHSGTH